MNYWKQGERVQVSLPYGEDDKTVHSAHIARIRQDGPVTGFPNRNVLVAFDDPLIFGGTGEAWVDPKVLTRPGEEPAPADHAVLTM